MGFWRAKMVILRDILVLKESRRKSERIRLWLFYVFTGWRVGRSCLEKRTRLCFHAVPDTVSVVGPLRKLFSADVSIAEWMDLIIDLLHRACLCMVGRKSQHLMLWPTNDQSNRFLQIYLPVIDCDSSLTVTLESYQLDLIRVKSQNIWPLNSHNLKMNGYDDSTGLISLPTLILFLICLSAFMDWGGPQRRWADS